MLRILLAAVAGMGLAAALKAEPPKTAPKPVTQTTSLDPHTAAVMAVLFSKSETLPAKADPFAGSNATKPAKPGCHCTGPDDCDCGDNCTCPACLTRKKEAETVAKSEGSAPAPKKGDKKVFNIYGRGPVEFTWDDQIGWYKDVEPTTVTPSPVIYSAPQFQNYQPAVRQVYSGGGGCSS